MSAKGIIELKDVEKGKDIYIIGSGSSIDHVPDSFWSNKICIGVNYCVERVPCKYGITHHWQCIQAIEDSGAILVLPQHEKCMHALPLLNKRDNYYWYKHAEQDFTRISLADFDNPEYLTAGGTIVTTAISLAHHLGAANIILCGVDEGAIDGNYNYEDYMTHPTNYDHCANVKSQLQIIINHVRSLGVPVVSINPFYSFMNEGHVFEYWEYADGYTNGGHFVRK